MVERVAVVTGAASGIGRACVARFTELGYRCVAVDRSPIAESPSSGRVVTGDVTDPAVVARAAQVAGELGRPEVLVNAAGITGRPGPVESVQPDEAAAVLAVNVTGPTLFIAALLPLLSPGASIVNLSSAIGLVGGPGQAVYAASKHAVVGLTKSVALDVAARGIRVNCLCPGIVDTPMSAAAGDAEGLREAWAAAHPLGRFAQPEEIAAVAAWLCSPEASFITGAAIPVDGGYVAA